MKIRFVIYELYTYFDCKFYKLQPTLNSNVSNDEVTSFLIELHKEGHLHSLNYHFIYKYLLYQYDYWNDRRVGGFGNHTRLANIFGKKAYSRFRATLSNPKYNWYNAEKTLKDTYGISRDVLSRFNSNYVKDYKKIHRDEECEKMLFDDSNVQLVHCIDNTTLFNNNSEICQQCQVKDACKKVLKQMYYRIYIKRGYGNKTSIKQES
jgi:hypothetical protein